MTVVETVLFSGVVDVKAYALSELDNLGSSWDASRWKALGEGEICILQPSEGGDIRCVVKGTGVGNKDEILSNHFVHPETFIKTTVEGKGKIFWVQDAIHSGDSAETVDTCLDVLFQDESSSTEFERQYSASQTKMAELHKDTRETWALSNGETNKVKTPVKSPLAAKLASPPKSSPTSSTSFATEAAEEKGGYEDEDQSEESGESDVDYEQFDDGSEGTHYSGSSGSCSEISLESTDEDERAEMQQRLAHKKMVIPNLKSQQNMWKCLACTTPNPEDAEKCLCCEVPKGEKKPLNKDKGPKINFSFANTSTSKPQEKPSFNFSGASDSKPSFDFSGTSQSKPSFDFSGSSKSTFGAAGETKPTFSFASASSDKNTDPPAFQFGNKTEDSAEEGKKGDIPKIEQETKAKASPYPPMETMKKVEPLFPAKKEEAKPKASPYPPMETMKKVEPLFPAKKEEPKPKASPYPPMETMKKVEPLFPAKKEEAKPKSSPYPPMETMKKVEPLFPAKKQDEMEPTKAKEEGTKDTGFGFSNLSFGKTSTDSPFATTSGSLFGSSKKDSTPAFGSTGFGSTPLAFGKSPDTGLFGKPLNTTSPQLFSDKPSGSSLFGSVAQDISKSSSSEKPSFKDQVSKFYEKYNPEKLANVEGLMVKFQGREKILADNLCKKYNLTEEQKLDFFPPLSGDSSTAPQAKATSSFGFATPSQSTFSGFSSSLGNSLSSSSNAFGSVDVRDKNDSTDEETDDEANANAETPAAPRSLFNSSTTNLPTFASPTLETPSFGFASSTASPAIPSASNSNPPASGGNNQTPGLGGFGQSSTFGTPSFGTPSFGTPAGKESEASKPTPSFGGGFASFAGEKKATFGDGSSNSGGFSFS